jgi:hypothetical protein
MLASHARLLAFFLLACGGTAEAPAPATSPAPAPRLEAPQPEASRADPPGGNPLQALAPAEAGDDAFAGVVEESIPAGGYTYLRVATEDGDRWVATMGKGARVGHRVHVKNMGTRHDFHSRRLGRRFDELAFGIVREA